MKLVTLDHLSILAKEMKGEYVTKEPMPKPVSEDKKEVTPAKDIRFTCELAGSTGTEVFVEDADVANDDDIRKMFHDS